MKLCIIATLLLSSLIIIVTSQTLSVTTFAEFTYLTSSSSCHCYPGAYSCTTTTKSLTATFTDPIPHDGNNVTITSVEMTATGSLFCSTYSVDTFHTDLQLNNVQLNPLIKSGSYGCSCACVPVSNTTSFSTGLSGYVRGGLNTINMLASYSTNACFPGFNVTLYYTEGTPTASPSPRPSGSPYHCCVYIGEDSEYSITCTTATVCPIEDGYTLISQFPSNSCSDCFIE